MEIIFRNGETEYKTTVEGDIYDTLEAIKYGLLAMSYTEKTVNDALGLE